jgi:hypothetical protein
MRSLRNSRRPYEKDGNAIDYAGPLSLMARFYGVLKGIIRSHGFLYQQCSANFRPHPELEDDLSPMRTMQKLNPRLPSQRTPAAETFELFLQLI